MLAARRSGCAATSCPPAINTVMAGLGWFAVNSVSGAFALATLTGMPDLDRAAHHRGARGRARVRRSRPRAGVRALREHRARRRVHHRHHRHLREPAGRARGIAEPQRLQLRRLHAHRVRGVRLCGRLEPVRIGLQPLPAEDRQPGEDRLGGRPRQLRLLHRADGGRCRVGADRRLRRARRRPTPSSSGMPIWIADITLVAIAIGAIAANALNIYSGAMSFLAAGVQDPVHPSPGDHRGRLRRHGIRRSPSISILAELHEQLRELPAGDRLLDRSVARDRARRPPAAPRHGDRRRSSPTRPSTATRPGSSRLSSPASISIWLFSNQVLFTGFLVREKRAAGLGSATSPRWSASCSAAVLYFLLFKAFKPKLGGPLADEPDADRRRRRGGHHGVGSAA